MTAIAPSDNAARRARIPLWILLISLGTLLRGSASPVGQTCAGCVLAICLIQLFDTAAWRRYPHGQSLPWFAFTPVDRRKLLAPFTLLAAISLLVCLTSVFWAIATYRSPEAVQADLLARIHLQDKATSEALEAARAWQESHGHTLALADIEHANALVAETNRLVAAQNRLVAQLVTPPARSTVSVWIAGLSAILPVIWVVRWRWLWHKTVWRLSNNLCVACGYDLRASEERCPECGGLLISRCESAQ